MSLSRHTIIAGLAALSLAVTASPALAQGGSGSGGGGTGGGGTGGGGGGGTISAVDPTAQPWALCPDFAGAFTQPDGSVLFGNQVTGVGCLVARTSAGSLSIYQIDTAPGWVSSIKSSDPSKLDVMFTWPATGEKHEIMVQPGKTAIR